MDDPEEFDEFDELVVLVGVVELVGFVVFMGLVELFGLTGAGVTHSFPFQTSPVLQTIQVTPLK